MASEQGPARRDLVVLVADANMEFSLRGLLARPEALGIRRLDFLVVRHPERDPGVFLRGPEFLAPFMSRFEHALALMDREGSGRDDMTRKQIERDLHGRLSEGWAGRAGAVVFDPELEAWLWSDSPEVDAVLGWKGRQPSLREWLAESGHLEPGQPKPARPKEAVEKALRIARKPRSSSLYRELASRVSLRRCEDPAFRRFRELLQGWFAASGAAPP